MQPSLFRISRALQLGPVVRRPVSANPGLNLNMSFFFLLICSQAFSRIIYSILFRASNHQIVGKGIKLNLLFKLSYLNWNFALTRGYLNPVLNNPFVRSTEHEKYIPL